MRNGDLTGIAMATKITIALYVKTAERLFLRTRSIVPLSVKRRLNNERV